jgi:hypothetical protein
MLAGSRQTGDPSTPLRSGRDDILGDPIRDGISPHTSVYRDKATGKSRGKQQILYWDDD